MKMSRELISKKRRAEAGLSLLETMVALTILVIVSTGMMGVAGVALSTTETQGHLAARTAEYAQDKMEQLLALRFGDSSSNTAPTTGYITTSNGGSGLAPGGSLSTSAPVAQYVDYLDASGNPVASTAAWEYIRVWQITAPTGTLKQISVKTKVSAAVGYSGRLPESTVVALKSSPF
jgi:Tfp pilus assembly protein PilV